MNRSYLTMTNIPNGNERCVLLAKYLISEKTTVRGVAAHFGISKSTVHKDIAQTLKKIDHTLYIDAKAVLELNKKERHLRGGEATRKKYKGTHSN